MREITSKNIADNLIAFVPLSRKILCMGEFTNKQGIMPSHMRVLLLLTLQKQMSTSQIGKRLDISKPNVTPIIDKLDSLGFVQRVNNEKDRRVIDVAITPEGKNYVLQMRDTLYKKSKAVFSQLPEAELLELNEHMIAVNRILKKLYFPEVDYLKPDGSSLWSEFEL